MKSTMGIREWQAFACTVRGRAESVSNSMLARARKACRDAGLDPNLLGIHPHNAMCGYQAGKPWPGVDYSKVRLCLRLIEESWGASRLADRIINRAWERIQ